MEHDRIFGITDPGDHNEMKNCPHCNGHQGDELCWTCEDEGEITKQEFDMLKAEEAAEYDENN